MEQARFNRPAEAFDDVYRETEMKALLSPAEWETYRSLATEAQVCIAHLVVNGKSYAEALRFIGTLED